MNKLRMLNIDNTKKISDKISIHLGLHKNEIFIKGIPVEEFEDDGIVVPYAIIHDMEFQELEDFCPIRIDHSYSGSVEESHDEIYTHIDSFVIHEARELEVDVYIIIISPKTLTDEEMKLEGKFIRNYKKIVDEREDCEIVEENEFYYDDVNFEKAQIQKKLNRYNPDTPIQFFATIKGFCYQDIYKPLAKLLRELDEAARKASGL